MLKRFYWFFLAGVSVLIALNSCEEKDSNVGVNLQPDSDEIQLATDTLEVITQTVRDNEIASDERSLSLLGEIKENDFGKTSAGFFTQIRLSSSNVSKETEIMPDSIMLRLDYSGFYGNTLNDINFELYQVKNRDFEIDSAYYSNTEFDQSELKKINNFSFKPLMSDSVVEIVIKDQDFIEQFSNPSVYADNETFLQNFKGIYLKPISSSGEGSIVYFDLLSEDSRMDLFYHNNQEDSLIYEFLINTSTVRINMFDHDYSSAPDINSALNSESNEKLSYLQSAGGLKVEVKIKNKGKLDSLANQGINRAQLQVRIEESEAIEGNNPENLTLVYQNDEGLYEFLSDYKVSVSHFGGQLDKETKDHYTFNIPLYIQDLLKNDGNVKVENPLYLFPLKNRISAENCIIYGGSHKDYPMQIKIVASEY